MKICLDLRYKTESGGSSYIKNVVPAILKAGPQHRYFGVIAEGQMHPFLDRFEQLIQCPSMNDAVYMAWTLGRLPGHLRAIAPDIYHGMKMPGPWFNPVRTVHTMHSVLRDKIAGFPSTTAAKAFVFVYGAPILRRLDRFIAVSQFVRNDLIHAHGVSPERIDVVPHGIDTRYRRLPPDVVGPALAFRGLRRYLISVGNVFPVKNHVTSVRAFARLSAAFPDLQLVIAGGLQDDYARRVRAEITAKGLEGRVKLLGMVKPDELSALLNGAELMLFPSVTEGFGISVLESMACGVPTIASRIGALGELDCAAFVDNPFDDAGFAAQARRFLENPALREEASRRVVDLARRFTWENAAEAHLATYERALAAPRARS